MPLTVNVTKDSMMLITKDKNAKNVTITVLNVLNLENVPFVKKIPENYPTVNVEKDGLIKEESVLEKKNVLKSNSTTSTTKETKIANVLNVIFLVKLVPKTTLKNVLPIVLESVIKLL